MGSGQWAVGSGRWADTMNLERQGTKSAKEEFSALFASLRSYGDYCQDHEDWDLEMSPAFWQMVQQRRERPTIPLRELEASLLNDDCPQGELPTDGTVSGSEREGWQLSVGSWQLSVGRRGIGNEGTW